MLMQQVPNSKNKKSYGGEFYEGFRRIGNLQKKGP